MTPSICLFLNLIQDGLNNEHTRSHFPLDEANPFVGVVVNLLVLGHLHSTSRLVLQSPHRLATLADQGSDRRSGDQDFDLD